MKPILGQEPLSVMPCAGQTAGHRDLEASPSGELLAADLEARSIAMR
jgi:hypothetical protein